MTQLVLAGDGSPFDRIRHIDPVTGEEYWSARDLQPLMGYDRWESFQDAITRASIAATNAGITGDHFRDAPKVIEGGRWGTQTVQDYRLTRYGAYLLAMNGDPRKAEVAAAQTYFAVRTHEAETAAARPMAVMPSHADSLRGWAAELERREVAEARVAELEPVAAQAEHFRKAEEQLAIGDFCNDLALWARENLGIRRLLHQDVRDFLGELGLVIRGNSVRNNKPTADAIARGLVRPHHFTFDTKTRGAKSETSTRLTKKGWSYAWDKAVQRLQATGSIKPTKDVEKRSA